ncbi:MAG TPA: C40 family peptidase [Edaphocola sp.]|nr:C40 family peptidase [Edaphocola sp.]
MKGLFKILCFVLLISVLLSSCAGIKAKKHHTENNTLAIPPKKINRKALIEYAERFVGVPYKYGGNTPEEGFDCSGYVKYVFNHFKIEVPRVTRSYSNFGKKISLKEVQIGDLILFSLYDDKNTIGHIGIVSSTDNGIVKFLHAASGKKSHKVMESDLKGVHLNRMLFITRVLP